MADILIQGGEVLDPGQGLRGRLDIAVSQGKITQIASHIDPREAQRVVDVSGKVVVPGLIDLHARGVWLKCSMKMLASIKTRRPDGRKEEPPHTPVYPHNTL
jgi:predicted amidohydrolase